MTAPSTSETLKIYEGIRELARVCEQTAVEHGWWIEEQRNIGEIAALFHSEVTEFFEEYRKGNPLEAIYYEGNSPKPEGCLVELADVLIRMLDLIQHKNLTSTFLDALFLKLAYNETRPYRHGGKLA